MTAQLLFVGLSSRMQCMNRKLPPPKSIAVLPSVMALPLYFPLGRASGNPVAKGNSGRSRTPWGGNRAGNRATMTALPLQRTRFAGVYRRGSRFVVVYRSRGRQRKQAAATLAEACAIKLARDAEARAERRGPTLHAYAL